MILTALEADLVELVSAGHLLLCRVHGLVADRALGRLGRLERHPESCTSEGGDDEQSTEEHQIWPHLLQGQSRSELFKGWTQYLKKACPRLRDPGSWLPLAAGVSSRNLGQAFLRQSV